MQNFKLSVQFLIVACLCVCMYWQEMGIVHGACKWRAWGFDQGPAHPWTTCSAANTPPLLSDSRPSWCTQLSTWDWLFSQRPQHEQRHLHRGWSILGFPVPVVSDIMNGKNRGLAILYCSIYVFTHFFFFGNFTWKLWGGEFFDFKVATTVKQRK